VENVKLLDRYIGKKPANGSLYLTATHLIYVEASGAARKETWIALHHIATVEKLPVTSLGCPLILRCKNFRVAHFVLESEVVCHEIYISLLKLSQPVMSSTYLRLLMFPPPILIPACNSSSLAFLMMCSAIYVKLTGSLPFLSFFVPIFGQNIPLIFHEGISSLSPSVVFLYFYALFIEKGLLLNALANRAAGKGYENEDNYANIRFRFMSIENIHVMRSSLQKLLEVCELKTPTMSEFLSGLESSGWLRHIKAIMDAGIFIAKAVKVEKTNVLVHCSDGWDRTAQVCSVASILLDPFYRTFKGLMILIEKEWICMGHKFSQRCGHLDGDSKEVSPIFTQFLDCIWQLMEQFPCAFEFNENFLLEIHDHVFSCQFGNFLGNCQKDRDDLRIYEKTHSVWPFLVQRKPDFRNPLYKGFTVYGVLNPSTVPYNIQPENSLSLILLMWCHARPPCPSPTPRVYSNSDKQTIICLKSLDPLMHLKTVLKCIHKWVKSYS
ncbi:hypothetical protein FD754_019132, partial [Muntiacus muntjak]